MDRNKRILDPKPGLHLKKLRSHTSHADNMSFNRDRALAYSKQTTAQRLASRGTKSYFGKVGRQVDAEAEKPKLPPTYGSVNSQRTETDDQADHTQPIRDELKKQGNDDEKDVVDKSTFSSRKKQQKPPSPWKAFSVVRRGANIGTVDAIRQRAVEKVASGEYMVKQRRGKKTAAEGGLNLRSDAGTQRKVE